MFSFISVDVRGYVCDILIALKQAIVLEDLCIHTSMLRVYMDQCTPALPSVAIPIKGGVTIRANPCHNRRWHYITIPAKYKSWISPGEHIMYRKRYWTFYTKKYPLFFDKDKCKLNP